MNGEQPKFRKVARGAPPVQAGSAPVRYLTIILIVLSLGAVWMVAKKSRKENPPVEVSSVPTRSGSRLNKSSARPAHSPAKLGDETPRPQEAGTGPTTPAPVNVAVAFIPSQAIAPAEPEPPRPEPTPLTRQLVTSLTQLDLRGGAVTPEHASQWKLGLQQLVQQGADAVPAIREFLERNLDLRFDGVQNGNVNGYPSLRAGLFDALLQIGGPEALEVSRQVLHTTADPLEIALLARNLEQQSPGQYRIEALNAARMVLEQAARETVNVRDVAPLFQVFQTYGDARYVAAIQHTLPKWGYYETLAMAGLPEGQGVPFLINQVQDPKALGTSANNFALQMLAQLSPQHPEAANALVDQTRLNQVPDSVWGQIGPLLAGDQFQFGSQFFDNTMPPPAGDGVKTYHIEYGNQNFYTTPSGAALSTDQINQRRGLIDQLLGATSNPAAVAALQAARNAISGRQAKP